METPIQLVTENVSPHPRHIKTAMYTTDKVTSNKKLSKIKLSDFLAIVVHSQIPNNPFNVINQVHISLWEALLCLEQYAPIEEEMINKDNQKIRNIDPL
jgi:hypothetical protein